MTDDIPREKAYDMMKEDENILLTSIGNLSDSTKKEIIQDLQESRQDIMEMENTRKRRSGRGPSDSEIQERSCTG